MYEILKHAAKQTTTLFTSPCESMAKARFTKSASLLKPNETLELWHEGELIDSVSKSLPKDEDGQIIFPEAASTLETRMKSLYCIAGILPAQFRSSQVDCGIGWKEHAKQKPLEDKEPKEDINAVPPLSEEAIWARCEGDIKVVLPPPASAVLEIKEQLKERLSIKAEIEAKVESIKQEFAKEVCEGIKDSFKFVANTIGTKPSIEQPLDTMLQEFETAKETAKQEFTKESFKEFVSKIEQSPVWFGIDPAAERQPSIDLSTIKPGDKVMLVDGETFTYDWARDFTKNKVYEVCDVDMEDTEGMQIRLIDDVGDLVWVYTADVRAVCSNVSKGEL